VSDTAALKSVVLTVTSVSDTTTLNLLTKATFLPQRYFIVRILYSNIACTEVLCCGGGEEEDLPCRKNKDFQEGQGP
jgi:hypothetical protein